MKFTFIQNNELEDNELVISHNSNSKIIDDLHEFLIDKSKEYTALSCYRKDNQYFLNPSEILFFETSEGFVYAHTHDLAYECTERLYELEGMLPSNFVRISKSTICNILLIHSISRNITSNGLIKFRNTDKEVYVSRMYYPNVKLQLEKRI